MSNTRWLYTAAIIIVIAVLVAFLYAVRGILPPFLIAFAIAWLLDPLLDRLQSRGCPRVLAVLGVYAIFLAAFVVGLIFLVPAVIDQAVELGRDFPEYSERFKTFAAESLQKHRATLIKFELPTTLEEVLATYGHQATDTVTLGIRRASAWIASNLSKALWFILIPLVAFYFLNDIDRIRKRAVLFIPAQWRPRTTEVLSKMGAVFSSYVRGLLIVCLLFGAVTTTALTTLNVKYAIILGILAGFLYAVPYLGAILITLLVFLVDLATQGVVHALWMAAIMVLLNQVIFDAFITPRILGKSVGLHPVLSLFALMAGAKLFGLVGMVLAVPVAASIREIAFEFYPELKTAPAKRPRRKSTAKGEKTR